jgi:hypothetical protein
MRMHFWSETLAAEYHTGNWVLSKSYCQRNQVCEDTAGSVYIGGSTSSAVDGNCLLASWTLCWVTSRDGVEDISRSFRCWW